MLDQIHKAEARRSLFETIAGAPEVAVVINCRNYEKFVSEAIFSVAKQTYRKLRCVVVDDASTDNSRKTILRALTELNDTRFSLLPLAENVGQLKGFQLALANTPSHLVAFLDADDYWFPEFLECHVRAHLNTIRSAPLSGSDTFVVDGQGVALEGTFSSISKPRINPDEFVGCELPEDSCPNLVDGFVAVGPGEPLKLIYATSSQLTWHWVNTSSMVFRRDFIDIAIPTDGEPRERHADYFLAYLAQILGGSLILPGALGVYRMHRDNLFARLPRIGGRQNSGVEPAGALRYTHECLVRHVMLNWNLFESLVGPEILIYGLRRFLPWRELDGFAARNGIDIEVRRTLAKGIKSSRVEARHGLERFAIKFLGF